MKILTPLFIPGGRVGSFSANIQISQMVRLSHIKWKNIKRTFQISNWRPPKIGWMGSLSAKKIISFTIGLLYIKWKVMMCTFEISNSQPPKISWIGLLSAKIKLSRTWRCRISNESPSTLCYIYHTSNLTKCRRMRSLSVKSRKFEKVCLSYIKQKFVQRT